MNGSAQGSVLVAGIYLADRSHYATHLVECYQESRLFSVTQAWIALGGGADSARLEAVTMKSVAGRVPKFTLLNRLLRRYDLEQFDFVVITDDDIRLPPGFLDAFLGYQRRFDFALAQPARTLGSFTDHKFVMQRPGIIARRTRFVEIGPVFSIRRDLLPLLTPFDETSPMGWGYDQVWPFRAEQAQVRLGIVDATPVEHSLRPQGTNYSRPAAAASMRDYLVRNPHLPTREAQVILEAYRCA